jgi:large subunit ribosomal protein L6
MSKIGSKPIAIPEGVTVELKDGVFVVKGKLGTLMVKKLDLVQSEIKDGAIHLTIISTKSQARANWGTLGTR